MCSRPATGRERAVGLLRRALLPPLRTAVRGARSRLRSAARRFPDEALLSDQPTLAALHVATDMLLRRPLGRLLRAFDLL